MSAIEPATASAIELAAAIRAKKITSEEATRAAIAGLKRAHERCNAVVSLDEAEALADARAADAALAKGAATGPLHGVPLAHKDMFDRTGKIASWGAKIRADRPAGDDATPLARLKAAGALHIAGLHLTEFAFGPTGHNYILGHARNPYDPKHVTGGSSAGSACSVAMGAVPAALGSDTAGSLRLPAAACNVTSLKGTWTRVSRAGAMPLSPSLDCVGPIARDVRDVALMMGLIAGHDPRDAGTSRRAVPDYLARIEEPVKGLAIGVDETLVRDADASVQARLETALKALEKAGARRIPVKFANWRQIDSLTQLLQLPEVASAHGRYIRTRADDYGPQVRARLEYGHFISGADQLTAARARGQVLARVLAETFAGCSVVALPTFADPLPTIAELDVGGGPQLMAAMARVIYYTRPVNYLGLPALTLPYARGTGELPNGFQLVGRPFSEGLLLRLGRAYQKVVPPEVAG
ncbi:MAG: amidase [Hyphomicrobiaceae bacterium]